MSAENLPTPRHFRSPRANKLAEIVKQEIELYHAGHIQVLSPSQDLADEVGYSHKTHVAKALREAGLLEERIRIIKETERVDLVPSRDWAWMVGILCGGGYVDSADTHQYPSSLEINTKAPTLMKQIKSTGERIFKTEGKFEPGDIEKKRIFFHNTQLPKLLGDLRRQKWADTVRDTHGWILEDSQYLWGFVEGLFDTVGGAKAIKVPQTSATSVTFNICNKDAVNFLAEVLVIGGVKNPKSGKKEIIKKVGVYNLADAQLIAKNITCHVPELEEKLKVLRNLPLPEKPHVKISSANDLIDEWSRLKGILGHPPTITDIKKLREKGETPYDFPSYAYRFGGNSFPAARETLEKIVASFTAE